MRATRAQEFEGMMTRSTSDHDPGAAVQALLTYVDRHAADVLFNVAAITLFFTLARIVRLPTPIAIFAAFSPFMVAWVYQSTATNSALRALF